MATTTRSEPAPFLDAFAAFERERGGDAVHAFRKGALARYAAMGIPTTKVEEWCFTNVVPHARRSYRLARPGAAVTKERVKPLVPGPGLVFVDGHYRADLSTPPAGVAAKSLAAAMKEDAEVRALRTVTTALSRPPRFGWRAARETPFAGALFEPTSNCCEAACCWTAPAVC